ncbi:MAG: RdgB/HAM1 family non-canonical purine NTP pyrophosphatase [Chloroflexi bacterium]|nr:RdgB/HAM1 family non-canonical purine NTP pyrophosphatase [Chloroflexota bacterium]
MQTLLIATHNSGKLKEYQTLFANLPVQLVSLREQSIDMDVDETGTSFVENAILKARSYSQASQLLTLADDSGLEVDALDGAPGIYSARYGGVKGAAQHQYLLDQLTSVTNEAKRSARFRCVIALCDPQGRMETVDGSVEGQITFAPRGEHGFGYDPLFYLPEYDKTMAELAPSVKNQISHRAVAARALRPILAVWLGNS